MTKKSSNSAALPRGLGFWTGWFVVVASMVGSGILTNSGPILVETRSPAALLFLWTLGGVLALCGALTLSELSSGRPKAGGDYVFVQEAFGPAWGFVYGWAMVLLGFAAPVALISYTASNFFLSSLNSLVLENPFLAGVGPETLKQAVATFFIAFFTLSHTHGHQGSAGVQAFTTLFKVGTLCVFICLVFWATGAGSWFPKDSETFFYSTWSGKASGLILVLYAYTGWNGAAYLAGEIKNPEKNVPRCLIWGTVAVTAFYLAMNLAYLKSVSITEILQMSEADRNRLVEWITSKLAGQKTSFWVSICVSVGVLASVSAYILTGPRIVYAMALDRLIPSAIGRLHSKNQTPTWAVYFQGLAAILFLWTGTFEQVLNFTGFGLALISLLVVSPIFVFRKSKLFQPKFRLPFYPWIPLAYLVSVTFTLVGSAIEAPVTAFMSSLSISIGFPIYYFLYHLKKGART